MKPWIIKYLPKTAKDMVNQKESAEKLKNYIENYKSQKKKSMLLYGPPGVGKTSLVYVIANDLDLEIIEVNASDFRNKDKINSIIGTASKQMSLFAKGKVILVDEVDGLSGTKDRGGMPALVAVIKKSSHPIILTALDPYDKKFSKLRSICEVNALNELNYTDIYERLKIICTKEGIKYEDIALKSLARRAGGDMRAAINDLQTIGSKGSLEKKDLEELSDRKQTQTIIEALVKIFKTTDPKIALSATDNINEDYDQLILWLDENLPKEYLKPEDLDRAYDKLSKANVYSRRIRRWQHWRFLVYIHALSTAGIAVSKDEKYKDFIKYAPTRRLLKIWMANQKFAKRKAIAQKLAVQTHTSEKQAIKHIPYLQQMFKDKQMSENITEFLDLNDDEVSWLS